MSDTEEPRRWTVLLPWDEILAYGSFPERLGAALALRRGLDRTEVAAALTAHGVPEWLKGKEKPAKVAAALSKSLECDLDGGSLAAIAADCVIHRVSETALLSELDPVHAVAVVGDAPEEVAAVLEERLRGMRAELPVALSSRVGELLDAEKGLEKLLAHLGAKPAECVLVSEVPARLERAGALGLSTFEIRDHERRLVGMLGAWIAARTPEDAGQAAEGSPGAEGAAADEGA